MPQYNNFLPAVNVGNQPKPLNVDPLGSLEVCGAISNHYNITAATVIKATKGRVAKVSVIVAGSTAGSVNDCATTGTVAVSNQVYAINTTDTVVTLDWPCTTGIVVTPGTGGTLAVSYI